MFNNPYFSGFNGYREPNTQQPIQNIINTQMPSNNMFMARFIKANETPQEIFVNSKTALISLENKKLHIKELDGTINTYDIVLPKDEKDLKIEMLEKEVNELKGMITNEQSNTTNVPTSDEIAESTRNDKKSIRK